MAHFAKLDSNNIVTDVIVVSNDVATDEAAGVAFLVEWSGGYTNWKQCSYNNTIRKQYPGIGFKYDEVNDVFVNIQPFPSWILNDQFDWVPPVPWPTDDKMYYWDEATTQWVEGMQGA